MNHDLYFIPLVSQALAAPDPKSALPKALAVIEALGQLPEYQNGYAQWKKFFAVLAEGVREQRRNEQGAMDQPAAVRRKKPPEDTTLEENEPIQFTPALEIVVAKDDRALATIPYTGTPTKRRIGNLTPGRFQINLDTGRLLWEGDLERKDLIWTEAYPDTALEVAAATEEMPNPPTREWTLLNGTMILRVFPGLESGRMIISIT